MGAWHAHYARLNKAKVVAIVDPDITRARRLASRFQECLDFESIASLPESLALTAAHICTPVGSHGDLIEQCIRRGIHMLVEKPLLAENDSLARILNEAQGKNLCLLPVHQLPFCRGFSKLVSRLGDIGELVSVMYLLNSAGAEKSPDTPEEVLQQMLPHPLSVIHRLGGDQSKADDLILRRQSDTRTEFELKGLSFPFEVVLDLMARPTRHELTVFGTGGTAYVDFFHGYCFFEGGEVSRKKKVLLPFEHGLKRIGAATNELVVRSIRNEPAYPGLRELIERFYACVNGPAPQPVPVSEIMFVAQCMDQFRALARTK